MRSLSQSGAGALLLLAGLASCNEAGDGRVLHGDLAPLHLEDHLAEAIVSGSEVPADRLRPVTWQFDNPESVVSVTPWPGRRAAKAERVLREPTPAYPAQLAMHPRTGDVYYGALRGGLGFGEVLRATRDGEVTRFRTSADRALGIAFHPDGGTLLVGDLEGVHRIRGDYDSIPCEVAYELAKVALGHAGGPPLIEHTLTVHFEGPVVRVHEARSEHAPNQLFLCPGSRVEFQAESTLGEARCWVSRGVGRQPRDSGAVTGTLQAHDALVCSNKPEGSDTDVFLLIEEESS